MASSAVRGGRAAGVARYPEVGRDVSAALPRAGDQVPGSSRPGIWTKPAQPDSGDSTAQESGAGRIRSYPPSLGFSSAPEVLVIAQRKAHVDAWHVFWGAIAKAAVIMAAPADELLFIALRP